MAGIIVLSIRSHFESTRNEEMIKDLHAQLETAEQEIIEAKMVKWYPKTGQVVKL